MLSIDKAGYKPGEDICLALDVAASELFQDNKYRIEGKTLDEYAKSHQELGDALKRWKG